MIDVAWMLQYGQFYQNRTALDFFSTPHCLWQKLIKACSALLLTMRGGGACQVLPFTPMGGLALQQTGSTGREAIRLANFECDKQKAHPIRFQRILLEKASSIEMCSMGSLSHGYVKRITLNFGTFHLVCQVNPKKQKGEALHIKILRSTCRVFFCSYISKTNVLNMQLFMNML